MITFKEYIINENPMLLEWRGGRSGGYNPHYRKQINTGKANEENIRKTLNNNDKFPYHIEEVSAMRDKTELIDGVIKRRKDGKVLEREYTVQIKSRQAGSGDDLLVNIISPWRGNVDSPLNGRDMRSKVDLYIVVDTNNKANIVMGSNLKEAAKKAYAQFAEKYLENGRKTQNTDFGQVRITPERKPDTTYGSGGNYEKVIGYISPSSVDVTQIDLNPSQ